MTDLIKYIYFPSGQENGMTKDTPVIVYCFDLFVDNHRMYIKASTNPEQAGRGSGQFLLANRAVIYSDELWYDCITYMNKKKKLAEDYENLFKKRNKK